MQIRYRCLQLRITLGKLPQKDPSSNSASAQRMAKISEVLQLKQR